MYRAILALAFYSLAHQAAWADEESILSIFVGEGYTLSGSNELRTIEIVSKHSEATLVTACHPNKDLRASLIFSSDEPFPQFSRAIIKAKGETEAVFEATLHQISPKGKHGSAQPRSSARIAKDL